MLRETAPRITGTQRRYQQVIKHCTVCWRPTHTGEERAWTGSFDAPHGEYRYECKDCEGTHVCWDCYTSSVHNTHNIEVLAPLNSRHGAASQDRWTRRPGMSSKALQRLHDRHR
jgi:hypothetical protein